MHNPIELTPDMLLGLRVEDARAAARAAGHSIRIHPAGAPLTSYTVPTSFTRTGSNAGIVVEAWGDLNAPTRWARRTY